MPRVTFWALSHLVRRTRYQNLTTFFSALRTNINQIIRHLDDIEVMFDDQDRISSLNQFIQHVKKQTDILEMQSRSRLIQDVERMSRVSFGKFRREFDTLDRKSVV